MIERIQNILEHLQCAITTMTSDGSVSVKASIQQAQEKTDHVFRYYGFVVASIYEMKPSSDSVLQLRDYYIIMT